MHYAVTWPSSDDHYAAVTVVKDDRQRISFDDYSSGQVEDIFDVSLYGDPGSDKDETWRSQSQDALLNLVELANLGLKTVKLVGHLYKESDRSELDWKAYYLSKAGHGDYDTISQEWTATQIREAFLEDDWAHMVHDYELEEAVEQGIGYGDAITEVLRFLGVEKDVSTEQPA